LFEILGVKRIQLQKIWYKHGYNRPARPQTTLPSRFPPGLKIYLSYLIISAVY
jgi:hypothetical protein